MKPSDGLMLETFQLNTMLITVHFAGKRYMKIKINTKMRDLRTKTVGNSLNVWIVMPFCLARYPICSDATQHPSFAKL